MSYHSRRILTPTASRKRKEREAFYAATSANPALPVTSVKRAVNAATTSSKEPRPLSSNRLLAGYMAYEFMTKGTLFGEKFDPAGAEAAPVSSADWNRNSEIESRGGESAVHRYAEVAHVLKSEGAHIPGVVNPTQLAKWIQM